MTDIELTKEIAVAFNSLDAEILNDLLSSDFEYFNDLNSDPIIGKGNFQHYVHGKFEIIKLAGTRLFVEMASLHGKPSLILAQGYKEDKSAYFTFDFKNGKVNRIKHINISPHKVDIHGTGDYPGLVENPRDCYMDYTIIPTKEDFIFYCQEANIHFNLLTQIPVEKNLEIIDWRMKYIALDDFYIPEEYEQDEDVIIFKLNYDDSIDLFYRLLEQSEDENIDERVDIFFDGSISGSYSEYLLTTALSPTDETKLDIFLVNKALLDARYYAFYIVGGITDNTLALLEEKFDVDPKLLVLNEDAKVIISDENATKTEISRHVMGLLILNKKEFQFALDSYITSETTFRVARVETDNKSSTKKESKERRQIRIDFGIDLPIKGGNGNSFYNAVIIEKTSVKKDYVETEYDYLKYIGLGRGIDWKILSQEVISKHGKTMDKIKIETTETNKTEIITQVENYYFDISECITNE